MESRAIINIVYQHRTTEARVSRKEEEEEEEEDYNGSQGGSHNRNYKTRPIFGFRAKSTNL